MSLQKQGFRFVRRGVEFKFKWIHKNEVLTTDLDCTDMTDEQFLAAVREVIVLATSSSNTAVQAPSCSKANPA